MANAMMTGAGGMGASAKHQNVGRVDRWLSGMIGSMMLTRGARHGGLVRRAAMMAGGTMLLTRSVTGHSMVYDRLGVSSATLGQGAGINIETAITIRRPRMELFDFWHNPTNFPLFMSHLADVSRNANGSTHWIAELAKGRKVEWDAEVFNESPGEYIAWRSVPGSAIEQAGSVHFTDAGDKGTEVHLKLRYKPPAGVAGFMYARALNPVTEMQVADDLRMLKHMLETGNDISTTGQPSGELTTSATGGQR